MCVLGGGGPLVYNINMKLQQLFLTIFVRPHDPLMLIVCKLSLCVSLSGWCMYYSGRQLVLSTTGNPTIKENIVNCFGLKQVNNIIIDTDWSLCGIYSFLELGYSR